MPRRKPGRPRKHSIRKAKERMGLAPQVSKEIIAIILFIIAFIFLLGLIGAAGSFGQVISRSLRIVFGYPVYLLPFFIAGLGVAIWRSTEEEPLKISIWLGMILFFVTIAGFFHLFVNRFALLEIAQQGLGGGLIGYVVASFFLKLIEFWGSLFVLAGLVLVSIILTFNLSFSQISEWLKQFRKEGKEQGMEEEKESFWSRFRKRRARKRPEPVGQKQIVPHDTGWKLPNLDLLEDKRYRPSPGDVKKNVDVIKKTLSNFGVTVSMGDVNIGPTVAQYTLKPATGIKLNQITSRANDISLALAAHPIRIEAPIPGRSAAGIEVPNKVPALVRLKEMLEVEEFQQQKSKLAINLGRDVAGTPVICDIKKNASSYDSWKHGFGKINLYSLNYSNSFISKFS